MLRVWVVLALIGCCLTGDVVRAEGKAYYSTITLIRESDLGVVGTVRKVGKDVAWVTVRTVLKGDPVGNELAVTPAVTTDMGVERPLFRTGEVVALFGMWEDGYLTVTGIDAGKFVLHPTQQAEEIAAFKRLIAIAALPDDDVHQAMITEACSKNSFLHQAALRYIGIEIPIAAIALYQAPLLSLLKSGDSETQQAVVCALQYARVPEAESLLIDLLKSTNANLVVAASQALGRYDTPEAVNALATLARHSRPEFRCRAALDLRECTLPDAGEALITLLDDRESFVRAQAAMGLIPQFRRGEANSAVPRLIALLNDPDAQVQAAAASALGESKDYRAVQPLLAVLGRGKIREAVDDEVANALYRLYRDVEDAQGPISAKIPLIIATLKRGGWRSSLGAIGLLSEVRTTAAINALKWAEKAHPNKEIRDYAKLTVAWIEEE